MMCGFSLKNISRSLPRNPSAYMQPQNGKAGFKPCGISCRAPNMNFPVQARAGCLLTGTQENHSGRKPVRPSPQTIWNGRPGSCSPAYQRTGTASAAEIWKIGVLTVVSFSYGRNQRNRLTSRSKRQYRPQQAVFSCRLQFRQPEKHENLPSSPKGFPQKLYASGSVHAMAEFKTLPNQKTRLLRSATFPDVEKRSRDFHGCIVRSF